MHTRRLVKRSILGSRVYATSPTGDGAPVTGVVQAVKQENRDASAAGPRRSVYTVLLQDGSLKEFSEEEIAAGSNHTAAKGPLKSSLKVCVCLSICLRTKRAPTGGLRFTVVVRCFAAFNRFLHGADLTVSATNAALCKFSRLKPNMHQSKYGIDPFCCIFYQIMCCHDIWRWHIYGTKRAW